MIETPDVIDPRRFLTGGDPMLTRDTRTSRTRSASIEGAGTGPLLEVAGVTKRYGHAVALDCVDLSIDPGEIVALLGVNGAGKTTLVSVISGLRRPDAGSLRVAGVDVVAHPRQARGQLGVAPQDLGIYPWLTVVDNLRYFGELVGLRKHDLAVAIDDVAEGIGLTALLGRRARSLSGGEKRRLHTAIALLHRPPLLLLDEPTVAADIVTRRNLIELVRRRASEGAGVCYSTHYLDEVEPLGATVALIDDGRILARASVPELLAEHDESVVELRFDGAAPELRYPGLVADGQTARVSTRDADTVVPEVMGLLGDAARRLTGLEVRRPSLETVFLAITGRHMPADGTNDDGA
jgi:ABC-2 type transport system ATP-binding protein